MKIESSPLDGCFVLHLEPRADERGWFKRTFDHAAFQRLGLSFNIDHTALSFNSTAGTLRGLHFQASPLMDEKLVQCVQGAIFDVVVDIRPNSKTLGRWFSIELHSTSHIALFIGKGFAHGFLTLCNDTLISYHMSQEYTPSLARGIRWDDPELAIEWPKFPTIIAKHDEKWPHLTELNLLDLDLAGDGG